MVPVRGMTIGLTLLAVLAAGAGLLVVARAARRGCVTLASAAGASVATASVIGVAFVLGAAGPLGPFGLVHLLYLAVVVSVPLLGAGLVASGWSSRAGVPVVALGVAMLVPAPLGVYATHVAPFRLDVDHREVVLDPARAGTGHVTVAVLADLQTLGVGDHERAAVQAVMDARPDVILLPGDLFQGDGDTLDRRGGELRDLLGELRAPGGVYFVQGDVDRTSRLAALLEGTGIVSLDDEVRRVEVRDRVLLIGGTRRDYDTGSADRVRRELIDEAGQEVVTILMSHRPDTVLELPPSAGIDLTVAGHTHGGQVSLPGLGPLITLSKVPRRVGAGGLHEVSGNRIYVSPGVGMERGQAPQVRFGVTPSVGVLRLSG